MKNYLNKFRIVFIGLTVIFTILSVESCKEESFLNGVDPNSIDVSAFPNKVEDLDLMVIDIYGRLRFGYFNSFNFNHAGILPDHTADLGYNGSGFNEWALNNMTAGDDNISNLWTAHYEGVARCNSILEGITKLRATTLSDDSKLKIDAVEGQVRFIRAINYYFLINFYGETMIVTEADKAKLGVPLWEKVPTSITDAKKERATVGQVWDFMIADLLKAQTLLEKQAPWGGNDRARVDKWAVKSFLGKAYLFTLQNDKAISILKEVIEKSDKKLLSFGEYAKMFNGMNEFSSESIFEINFTADRKDIWNTTENNSSQYGIFISPSYLGDDGVAEETNGFGNLYIHDANPDRHGFVDNTTNTSEMKSKKYLDLSINLRKTNKIDPRMTVNMLQPWVDSIYVNDSWRKVTKNRGEGFPLANNQAWCHRKFVLLNRSIWSGDNESIGSNMYFMRLPDVYLMYAEAQARLGNTKDALEYINKVHRRAYSLPVDAPASNDYKTLTDKTMALGTGDHLANDPLKYERYVELFAEGSWWFDVCRWKIGDKETAYYKTVKAGPLAWDDKKYALPIPRSELDNNSKIKPNARN
jgi:starch-binding outer membrane protein, SusD/RagB family